MSGIGVCPSFFQDVPAMEERGQLRRIVRFVVGEEQILVVTLLDG